MKNFYIIKEKEKWEKYLEKMYCPNCGVKINKLGTCEICGVDLQVLEKFNLIKDVPPQSNSSNIAAFSRSLRRRSSAINEFITKQKEYLETSKAHDAKTNRPAEITNVKEEPTPAPKISGRSLSAKAQEYKDAQEENKQTEFASQRATQPAFQAAPAPTPRPAAQEQTQQYGPGPAPKSPTPPPAQPAQPQTANADAMPAASSAPVQPEDEFSIPKLNNEQGGNSAQEQTARRENTENGNNESGIASDNDFDIPKLSNENGENSPLNTSETVKKAENLSVVNKKELKKIKTKEKTEKKQKRKGCGIFALILSIIVAFVIAIYVLSTRLRFGIGFIDGTLDFVEEYSNYFIWGAMLLTFFALLFNFIQLFMGSKKFRTIITLFILVFLGISWIYLHYIGQLIPAVKELIKFVKNLF